MRCIYIIPLGEIDWCILSQLRERLNFTFGFTVEIMPVATNPSYAFESKRKQYYSTKILENLASIVTHEHPLRQIEASKSKRVQEQQGTKAHDVKVIGITDVDLATPVLTFVFGEAHLNGTAAVISLTRLRQEFYGLLPNPKLLEARAVKEAIHELGHTFGLLHCDDKECVMHFSSNITSIDQKHLNFCANCLTKLQKELK